MRNYLFILFIAVCLIASNTAAQKCGSSLNMSLIQEKNPGLYNQLLQIENHTNEFISNKLLKSATVTNIIRIPVVVHVLYNTAEQNISDDQIQSQIEVLNEDYRRQNADRSNTPSEFSSVASDPQIEFFLACIDPNGNISNGITRTQTSQSSFTITTNPDGTTNETATRIKFTSLGGHDAWPSNRYLNIWTCNIAYDILGYAQFPGIGQTNTDGVAIMYNCFGKRGTLQATYNKGRTASHEIGHWLNLIHIWGDDDNHNGTCVSSECSGTDNVTDTPNQGESNLGCPTFPKTDCCSTSSPGVMFMNFMDYTDDACMNLFTTGQTNRMRALFTTGGFRECFVSNPVINNWCQSVITYSGSSLICSSGATISVNNVTGYTVSWGKSDNLTFDNLPGESKIFTANGTGVGWVQATIISGTCGQVTLPRKNVWVGTPNYNFKVTSPGGNPVTTDEYGNPTFCSYTDYEIIIRPNDDAPCYTSNHNWTVPSTWTTNYTNGNTISINTNDDPYNFIAVDAKSCCLEDIYLSQYFEYSSSCDQYLLSLTPNPSSGETTLSVVLKSKIKIYEPIEWDFEIYDSMQNIKTKSQKIKNYNQTINTSDWKDGVYIVHAKIGNEIITEKLVVKH